MSTTAVIIYPSALFVHVQVLGALRGLWTGGHGMEAGVNLSWLPVTIRPSGSYDLIDIVRQQLLHKKHSASVSGVKHGVTLHSIRHKAEPEGQSIYQPCSQPAFIFIRPGV